MFTCQWCTEHNAQALAQNQNAWLDDLTTESLKAAGLEAVAIASASEITSLCAYSSYRRRLLRRCGPGE
jgi:hypothetical protein